MIKNWAYFFGLLFLGDGTTIYRTPPLNTLVYGKNTCCGLELVDCQGNSADGGKKMETLYLIFMEHMKKLYPTKTFKYIAMFYRYSNFQIGCKLFKFHYSKCMVVQVIEHAVSLFSILFIKYQF